VDGTIKIGADVNAALAGINRIERSLGGLQRSSKSSANALASIERASSRLSGALIAAGVAMAGFAVKAAASGILKVTQEMEQYQTQLTTYLGSQQAANAEIQRLSNLARTLPQDVNELTAAFVVFQRNGLDTSNESMKAFSNIAAANGKSLIQFAEAVADGMTGEFERFKEFGIKVSTENGKFTAKIGEDQVAVATSTTDLVEKLKALGAEGGRFGSVTVGPLTLAMSNLRGAVFEATAALGQTGLALAISDAAVQVTDFISNNQELVQEIGFKLTKAFLTVKAAILFVIDNIGLLGKAVIAFFALKAAAAFTSFAIVIGSYLVKALALATRAFAAFTAVMKANPFIRAAALLIAGVELFTGAISDMASELATIGGTNFLDTLENGLGDVGVALGLNLDSLDEWKLAQENINKEAAGYAAKAAEANTALTQQEATANRIRLAEEGRTAAAIATASAFSTALETSKEGLRVSTLSKEEQDLINLQKEYEKKLNRELTQGEKDQLRELVNQTSEIQKQNRIRERTQTIADEIVKSSVIGAIQEQKALDGVLESIKERYAVESSLNIKSLGYTFTQQQLFEAEIAQLKTDNARAVDAKIRTIEERRIKDLLAANKSGLAAQLSDLDRFLLQRMGQEDKQAQIVDDRIEFEKKSDTEKAQWAIQQGATVFDALGKENKKAFELAKAFNIANAIMNTYAAATKALATYPFPFGLIAAAGAVAAGMVQVSQIRSQTYSGRALGGPVMGNTPYMVGENGPEIFTPASTGSITRNSDIGGGVTNVNFTIQTNDASGFDELLLQRRGMITQMISDAALERGSRSMI
jgi:hypothetical protein